MADERSAEAPLTTENVRQRAIDLAVHDLREDYIVEALSWAETVDLGRLGHERAQAVLDAHVERTVAERLALVPAQREAFLDSPTLDRAWIAGWHSAIDHVIYILTKEADRG